MRHLVAAALFALFACGKVNTSAPVDAAKPQPDGAPDAPSRGMVTVKVLDNSGLGSGIVGAEVVFIDPDLTQRVPTDGSGVATAFVEDGASLTTISPGFNGDGALLQTVFGVKSGDAIVLGFENTPSNTLGSFTINFTPINAGSDATTYEVLGPCGGTSIGEPPGAPSASVTLSFSTSCKLDPMELIVVARDATNGEELGFLDKRGVSFVAGGSTTIGGPFQPLLQIDAEISDGSALEQVDVDRLAPDNFGFVSGGGASPDGSGNASIPLPGPSAGSAVMETSLIRDGFGEQLVIEPIAGDALTYSLDVGTTALPWLGSATFDPATETMHVPLDMTDATSDPTNLAQVEVEYERATGSGGPIFDMTWIAYSSSAGDMTMPTLPGELAALAPTGSDTFDFIEEEVFEMTGASYDQFRAAPEQVFDTFGDVRGLAVRQRFAEVEANPPPPSMLRRALRAGSRGHSSPRFVRHGAARAR